MRDPRLIEAWATDQAIERERASRRLAAAVDRAELDHLLVRWWAETLAHESPREKWKREQVQKLRTKVSTLSAENRKFGLMAADTLTRTAAKEDLGVGAILLGESAAKIVGGASAIGTLDRAVDFLSESWEAVDALTETLVRVPEWPESVADLAPTATNLADLIERDTFHRVPSNAALLDEERRARQRGLLSYLWGNYFEMASLKYAPLVRLTLLAERDWGSVAREAEKLPLRILREHLWRHLHLSEDRDSVLGLIAAAPMVFAEGRWTGNTSPLTALVASIAHADRLHDRLAGSYPRRPDADESLRALEQHEIPDWLKRVAQAVIVRPDGRAILLLVGANLIREELHSAVGTRRVWSSFQLALSAIHDVLAPKPSVAELQEVARLGGMPSWRTDIDHATYLLTAAVFDSDATDVWTWYRALLLETDEALCSQARVFRIAFCYAILAQHLERLSDPIEEWRVTWRSLFVNDRERARFATLDLNALYPSLHLLRVGIELLKRSPLQTGARQFFWELLAHARCLVGNDFRIVGQIPPETAVDVIVVAPLVLGNEWRQELNPHLLLPSTAKYRLYIATLLIEGGASFADVEAAVEIAPGRLMDSVNELETSNEGNVGIQMLCKRIRAAAGARED